MEADPPAEVAEAEAVADGNFKFDILYFIMIDNTIKKIEKFLENIDSYRDKALFVFIRPYWPRAITPNHITWVRVAIGIFLAVLIFWVGNADKTMVVLLFVIGALTDLIDGPVARGTNRVTEFGAMLDSTADRILIIPIAFYGLITLHKWLLLSLILAEIINALVSIFYKSKEIYMESNIFGKTKMVLMSLVFIAILAYWPQPPTTLFLNILWISIIFSALSIFSKLLELRNKGHIENKILNKL